MSEEKTPAISALRQRMIEDMTARRLCENTQSAHIRAVRRLSKFLGRLPDAVNGEDLRRFQLHLVQIGLSPITINATISGLRFFLETPWIGPSGGKLVWCGSRTTAGDSEPGGSDTADQATRGIKYQTALSVAYGAGLRACEVIALKSTDVDSERMVLRVEEGKGHRTATRCFRRCCWSGCGPGGVTPSRKDWCAMADGCFAGQ